MSVAEQIISLIESRRNPEKAEWLENYVKHGIRSLGVGIPEIRDLLKQEVKRNKLTESPVTDQLTFLNNLMHQDYTEYKLAAILYLQLYGRGMDAETRLDLISGWFDQGEIYDWNVCDWLCVRTLSPMIDHERGVILPVLSEWNLNANLWKARASLVPFAQCKSIGEHEELIFNFSKRLIKREERFCKTAVGWVLREYSKKDAPRVKKFLEKYEEWTTLEVIRNATKYLKGK